jgi:hypothetical protein
MGLGIGDCQMPIADWYFSRRQALAAVREDNVNRQLAIDNWK